MDDEQRREIENLLEEIPIASGYFAFTEMHYGRLDWLAEHIRRCQFQIDPSVARKLLSMIEGSETSCRFELKAVRKSGLKSAEMDPQLKLFRDLRIVTRVVELGGLEPGKREGACEKAAENEPWTASTIQKIVQTFDKELLKRVVDSVEERRMEEANRQRNPLNKK